MAQKPLEADVIGTAPTVGAKVPRQHNALLRQLAAERGVKVSVLVRELIGQGLDAMQGGSQGDGHDV